MAFSSKNLSVINYANGWTMWHYASNDSIEKIITNTKYFKSIASLGASGDIMYITYKGKTFMCQIIEIKEKEVKIAVMQ